MKLLKSIWSYLGFGKGDAIKGVYPDDFGFSDNLDQKLEYLRSLESQEHARMTSIESKTSQLIGMTSIIFTLIGIFVANFLTKLNSLPNWLQILLIFIFLLSLLFYVNTIFQASRYMQVNKHFYGQKSATTVKRRFANAEEFKIEEVKDLIFIVDLNVQVTNRKINYLLYGYQSFRMATLGVGLLSVVMLIGGKLSGKPDPNEMVISKPITIDHLDSSLGNSISRIQFPKIVVIHDTIYLKK